MTTVEMINGLPVTIDWHHMEFLDKADAYGKYYAGFGTGSDGKDYKAGIETCCGEIVKVEDLEEDI